MRRNFAQILKEVHIDLPKEYMKLYAMFYGDEYSWSIVCDIEADFTCCRFRGTCLSLNEFNNVYGFQFEDAPDNFNVDYLVSFCEYIWNLMYSAPENKFLDEDCRDQIQTLIEKIGYTTAQQDGFTIFVEKSPAAVAVAESEIIPQQLSYKLISYNHHSMKGNLQEKKNTILQLADLLEPKREELTKADKSLSSDLFYLFNNLNLRHNNTDPAGKSYKKAVAEMAPEDLEQWYDETYQMCLLAFMQLEQAERKIRFDQLKDRIEEK